MKKLDLQNITFYKERKICKRVKKSKHVGTLGMLCM